MKNRYRSVKVGSRGGTFYCEDTNTGKRNSLRTKDEAEAECLVHAKNEAERQPQLNRRMGMAYLSATDSDVVTRTWRVVMDEIIKDKKGSTLKRYQTALKDPAFKLIEAKVLVETQPADFMEVLRVGTVSTNVYLRRFQNHAVDMDWLAKRILPKKLFPDITHKDHGPSLGTNIYASWSGRAILSAATFMSCAGILAVRSPTLPACRAKTLITKSPALPMTG